MHRDKLTAAERMKALVNGQGLDRVPVNPSITVHAAMISNMYARDYYLHPEMAYEAQTWAKKLYNHDSGIGYAIPEWYCWDFGGELEFPDYPKIALPRVIKRPVTSIKDIENIQMPNPRKAPAASRVFKFSKMVYKSSGKVSISAGAPMNIAGGILGTETLMKWMIKSPELVHRVLRVGTDYLIEMAKMHVEEFGAENVSAGANLPLDSHAIISPKMFERFSLPYIHEIHETYIAMGIKKWGIHLCGDHIKNLTYWKNDIKLMPRTVFTPGSEMDIEVVAKELGKEYIVGGNVKNLTLQLGTPREVYEESRQVIEKMKYNPGGFILNPDCALSPLTPSANVFAMIQAARDFGQYS